MTARSSPWLRLARALAGMVIVTAVAAIVLWVHLYEFLATNTWDAAQFLAMGKLLARGQLLYRDLWEMKPPGIFFYQRAVFAVLPVEVWSLRLADMALYTAAGTLFFCLCANEARWPLALIGTAVWVYFAHYPMFNNWGFYTEEYESMWAIAAVAAAARYWRRGGLTWVVASGFAVATAIAFKHSGVACGVPVAMLISGRRPLRALPLLGLSVAVLPLLVVALFWWQGSLAEFLDCNFYVLIGYGGYNNPGGFHLVERLQELQQRTWQQFAGFPGLVVPVVFGALVCVQRPTRMRLAALAWLLADLLAIGAQKQYFAHYFIQAMASGVLVAVLGAAWLLQRRPGERWFAAAPHLALGAIVVAVAWRQAQPAIALRQPSVERAWRELRAGPSRWLGDPGTRDEAEIGAYVKARSSPDDRLFVYVDGTGTAIYWTADRLAASRYLYPMASRQTAAREQEQWAELERTRPAYIVIANDLKSRHFDEFLLGHYVLATVMDWAELWSRLERAPFAAGSGASVIQDRELDGLVLSDLAAPAAPPLATDDRVGDGRWISPIIEVRGGAGDVHLDWDPRTDPQPRLWALAIGAGEPTAVALPDLETTAATGVVVRYRTGPTPDLTAAQWRVVDDAEGPRPVHVERYVQLEAELWSRDAGLSPVLRTLRVGRLQFQLEPEGAETNAPWQTASDQPGPPT